MQIPILNGIYVDASPDIRSSYPVNLIPIPKQSGVSESYLRPAYGIVQSGTGPGVGRGGIVWNNVLYRVMGTKLVSIDADGNVSTLGDVGGDESSPVRMDYSFDRLAIASGGNLYYFNGSYLEQVNDVDIGVVVDVVWVDGYFMTTDGEFLIVTELNDPTQVNPLKYISPEKDPDPVVGLVKLRNEIYAINRYTIEVFDNIGGDLFPFRVIDGALIEKGAIGTFAFCNFEDKIAFLGGGKNESLGIYVGVNADDQKISTKEIDEILLSYNDLSGVVLESVHDTSHKFLYVHLPDRTIVYDENASQVAGQRIWFYLTSSVDAYAQYKARYFVFAHGKWNVCDPSSEKIGYLNKNIGSHWGEHVRWEFGTLMLYNESRGVIINEINLISLTGSVALGVNPSISTSYSADGIVWSQDRYINIGSIGERSKRLSWFRQGIVRQWRIQRFRGDTKAHISPMRLEMMIEPLGY